MWIGLVFITALSAFSAEPQGPVKEARAAFMDKGRKEALKIIEKALKQASPEKRTKLLSEGEKLATRFNLDEAQREFELGESIYFSKDEGSLERYNNAEKLEPQNIQVYYAKLRYYLSLRKCSQAKTQLFKLKDVWRHSRLMPYFRIRVQECEGQSLSLVKVSSLSKSQSLSPYFKKLKIQALVEKGKGKEALRLSEELSPKESAFSEIYYWLFRAGELESTGQLGHLRKYIKLCQSYGAVERRSFELEPLLCEKTEEVRAMLRKRESGGV